VAWTPIEGRSAEIAAALGGEAACFFDRRLTRRWLVPLRYLISAVLTARYLWRRRPRAVIATNPPLIPGYVAWAYGAAFARPVVLDTHPAGFGAQGDRVSGRLQAAHRWLARRVTATMVTDPHWVGQLEAWGADGVVVHEAPPLWTVGPARVPGPRPVVLFAGTFGGDEPVEALLGAARLCSEADIWVTGDPRRSTPGLLDDLASNVTLTGFLGREDYPRAMDEADVVITLSTEPTSVMRAAYEAVYAGRPLVVSDWPGLKALFPYAVTVANDPEDIARGLREVLARHDDLRAAAGDARQVQMHRWEEQREALGRRVGLAAVDVAGGGPSAATSRVAGIPVSSTTWAGLEGWARATLDDGGSATLCTVAPYQAYLADHDPEYRRCLESASRVLVDGNGVRLLAAAAGRPAGARMTGRELVERVYDGRFLPGTTVAVVGGTPETLARLHQQRPQWVLAGERFADRPDAAVEDLAARLGAAGAQLVLVALGSPKMELWADALARHHNAVYASVGGAVDTVAGVKKAPPGAVARLGLEWAWRAAQDPTLLPRLGRGFSVMPSLLLRAVGERCGPGGVRRPRRRSKQDWPAGSSRVIRGRARS
jgi:exopolysaccharide biosynthesis WecB/TagA/CpsF family protein